MSASLSRRNKTPRSFLTPHPKLKVHHQTLLHKLCTSYEPCYRTNRRQAKNGCTPDVDPAAATRGEVITTTEDWQYFKGWGNQTGRNRPYHPITRVQRTSLGAPLPRWLPYRDDWTLYSRLEENTMVASCTIWDRTQCVRMDRGQASVTQQCIVHVLPIFVFAAFTLTYIFGSINSLLLDLHARAIQFLIGAMVLVFESWPQKFL